MKLYCFSVFILFTSITINAQSGSKKIDSLLKVLSTTTADTLQVKLNGEIGRLYSYKDSTIARQYLDKALAITIKDEVKNARLKSVVYNNLANLYEGGQDSLACFNYVEKALTLATKGNDIENYITILKDASDDYESFGLFAQQIACQQRLLKIYDSIHQTHRNGGPYLQIGNIMGNLGQSKKGLAYFKMAIPYNADKRNIDTNYRLALNYNHITNYFLSQKIADSALYYAQKSESYLSAIKTNINIIHTMVYFTAAEAFEMNKMYAQSLDYCSKVDSLKQFISGGYNSATLVVKANCYAGLNQMDSAYKYATKALEAAKKVGEKIRLSYAYNALANVVAKMGNYKLAYEYEIQKNKLDAAIRDEEIANQTMYANIEFQTTQKEQQIAALNEEKKQQNKIQWLMAIGLALAIVAGIFAYISYRSKRKAALVLEQSNKEKEVFLKEIHHRVKNNLQIISSLLYMQFKDHKDEKMIAQLKQAQERIKSMALVHNKLYEKQDVVHVYLKEYIADLAAGILSSNTPSGKKITLNIEENEAINLSLDTSVSLGLMLNELITNSCKYAFENKEQGQIDIAITKQEKGYKLIVKDDGTGLPQGFEQKNSLGVRLVKNLARQLSGSANFENNNGTIVTIMFAEAA